MHERRAVLLEALQGMPETLRRTADAMAGRLDERPATPGFSLREHVWHLADLERDGYATRIARLLSEEMPRLPDFDGEAVARERQYHRLDFAEGLQAFADARATNVTRLRALDADQWLRPGIQDGVGEVTVADVARMMGEHDAAHRAEIEALRR